MARAQCARCGCIFESSQALGGHMSGGMTCDEETPGTSHQQTCSSPTRSPPSPSSDPGHPSPSRSPPSPPSPSIDPGHPSPPRHRHLSLYQLLQRPCIDTASHRVEPTRIRPGSRAQACNKRNTYKLHEVTHICTHIWVLI
jgi:hypothetical protein